MSISIPCPHMRRVPLQPYAEDDALGFLGHKNDDATRLIERAGSCYAVAVDEVVETEPLSDGLSMVKPSKLISECIHLPLRGAGAAAAQAPKNEETNGRRCKPRPRSVPPMPLGEQRWQRPTGKADLAHIPSPREYEREVRRRRRRPIRTPL